MGLMEMMGVMGVTDVVVLLSVVFFASWCTALLLAEVWRLLWNWLDDHAQPIASNPLMAWVLRMFFRPDEGAFEVWVYVLMITVWPLYLAGLLTLFVARGARGLRRRYKQRLSAAVSA